MATVRKPCNLTYWRCHALARSTATVSTADVGYQPPQPAGVEASGHLTTPRLQPCGGSQRLARGQVEGCLVELPGPAMTKGTRPQTGTTHFTRPRKPQDPLMKKFSMVGAAGYCCEPCAISRLIIRQLETRLTKPCMKDQL